MPYFKFCGKCGAIKEVTPENFFRDQTKHDGFDNWCKDCCRAQDELRAQGRTDPRKKRKK